MATIDDVARRAGVSKSTVSNVFTKRRPISQAVTERVLAAARELDYRPNYWARSLARKETRIIGLVMPKDKLTFSPFHLALLNGVLKGCYETGYRVLVHTLSEEFASQPENVASSPVDGDILIDPTVQDPRVAERLDRQVPLVVIGRPPADYAAKVCSVDNDNVDAASRVTRHLLSLGHRNIVFLNAPKETTVAHAREAGFRMALAGAGLLPGDNVVQYKDPKHASAAFGYRTAKRLLESDPGITAIITDTDKVALGVYQAAAERGLNIPRDLSVFAFGDHAGYSEDFMPPLSAVNLNAEALGAEAAKLLIEWCSGRTKRIKQVTIAADLVIRGSCAAPGTD